jgi:hypothetical protein
MWLFTRKGLLSIVEHRSDKDLLIVRARQMQHLTDNFPKSIPAYTPDADYRYRITVPRAWVMSEVSRLVREIDYPNFKDAANPEFKQVYSEIWATGLKLEGLRYERVYPVDFDSGQSSRPLDPY